MHGVAQRRADVGARVRLVESALDRLLEFFGGEFTLDLGAHVLPACARTPREHPYYELTERIARLLSDAGFSVISGGGPGIMAAANRGAFEAGGVSVGLGIVAAIVVVAALAAVGIYGVKRLNARDVARPGVFVPAAMASALAALPDGGLLYGEQRTGKVFEVGADGTSRRLVAEHGDPDPGMAEIPGDLHARDGRERDEGAVDGASGNHQRKTEQPQR